MEKNSRMPLKVGLLIIALFWFGLTLYQFGRFLFNCVDVPFTDIPGSVGFAFRTVASFIAVVTLFFYVVKRDFSAAEAITSFRWIILLMAAYWLLFLPSAVWGFQYNAIAYPQEFFIIETGLPCLVEALVMPTVLVVLFFKLNVTKPSNDAIKWGLIAAAANIFVFWFNYTAQWWSEIYLQEIGVFSKYPVYMFEFIITVGGLLLLGIYAAVYAKNSVGKTLADLDLRGAGVILTGLGLYFDLIVVLWLLFGDVSGGALTVWPTFIVLHNVDLWMATLPLVGIPLMLYRKKK